MDAKINIAKILKDKPEGTKLWTDMFGSVTLYVVTDACDAFQVKHHNKEPWFDKEGKLCKEGVLCIYPSKSMRDWSKFAWKNGDILVNKDGDAHIIFEGFDDDTYETFNGNNYLWEKNGSTMCFSEYEDDLQTSEFNKANKEDAQEYIRKIEKRLGGKFYRETLEIEKLEFNDGDIVYADYGNKQAVFIVSGKTDLSEGYNSFIALDLRGLTLDMGCMSFFKEDLCKLRLAKEEEKKQLFDALTKASMAWDAEKKQIVDLKPKVEIKPFDKVLVRDETSSKWRVNLFGYKDEDGYYNCVYANWIYCIPYEGNEHLLGTNKDVEG